MFTDSTLSIIIPTHNKSAALQRTLQALQAQSFPMAGVQVIVVADACTDDTAEMASRLPTPYSLKVIEISAGSAAAARNAGAEVARGDLLLFLDDDVEPSPELVLAHVSAHQDRNRRLVLGPYPPVLEPHSGFFHMELARWWHDHFRPLYQPDHRFTYQDVCSGNFSLETLVYRQLGGMDPAFKDAGGEDYEFGIRVCSAGLAIEFAPRALAHHHDGSDLHRILQRTRQEGRSDVLIGRLHPEMRSSLPLGHAFDNRIAGALCNLAFRFALPGDMLAALLGAMLNMYERAHLRLAWYKTFQVLHAYWYWRGVADEIKSPEDLGRFLQEDRDLTESMGEIEIDLNLGLVAAEILLDQVRPAGMRLDVGEQPVGRVPASPGKEPLRGVHLRGILANEFARPLLEALALNVALGHPSVLSNEIGELVATTGSRLTL